MLGYVARAVLSALAVRDMAVVGDRQRASGLGSVQCLEGPDRVSSWMRG